MTRSFLNLLSFFFVITSCSSDSEKAVLSSEKTILKFEIENIITEINQDKILIYVDPSVTDYQFSPEVTLSTGATIYPDPTSLNYLVGQTVTITAEDGTSQIYTTELIINNGLEVVNIDFTYQDPDTNATMTGTYEGVIDEANKTIVINVSKEFLIQENVITQIEVKTKGNLATTPSSVSTVDVDWNSLKVIVDGVEKTYQVILKNIGKDLGCLTLELVYQATCGAPVHQVPSKYTEGLADTDLVFETLETQDTSNVMVTAQIMPIGVSITPSLDNGLDFSNDVNFKVVSESGSSNEFTVRVIKKKVFFPSGILGSLHPIKNDELYNVRYYGISKIAKLSLYNADLQVEIPCSITSNDFVINAESIIYFKMDEQAAIDSQFVIKIELENGSQVISDYNMIIYP